MVILNMRGISFERADGTQSTVADNNFFVAPRRKERKADHYIPIVPRIIPERHSPMNNQRLSVMKTKDSLSQPAVVAVLRVPGVFAR